MHRSLLTLSLTAATLTFAGPPESDSLDAASAAVQATLVRPLAQKDLDRSRFTRAALAPVARRVRVDEQVHTDSAGKAFHTFAIDQRLRRPIDDEKGGDWRLAVTVGCVYDTREVFVARGERHYPAKVLLGKKASVAPPHVCRTEQLAAR